MHEYSKMAINLKKNGWDQKLTMYDNIYLIKSNQYMQFKGILPDEEYVLVPRLERLISKTSDIPYDLKHEVLPDDKEVWTLKKGMTMYQHENIWCLLSNLWIIEKGNSNV